MLNAVGRVKLGEWCDLTAGDPWPLHLWLLNVPPSCSPPSGGPAEVYDRKEESKTSVSFCFDHCLHVRLWACCFVLFSLNLTMYVPSYPETLM